VSDWAVGDLAVCVDTSVICCNEYAHVGHRAFNNLGTIRITRVSVGPCGCTELFWAGCPPWGGLAKRFRKILPDKHEACETEFVDLLKRIKRPVSA
jgi:hypothetical protein